MSTPTIDKPPAPEPPNSALELAEKADANFIWKQITARLAAFVQQKYSASEAEKMHYTPVERGSCNLSLLKTRVVSSQFTWPILEEAELPNSGEIGPLLEGIIGALGGQCEWAHGDNCHPQTVFQIGDRRGVINVSGVRLERKYLLAVTLFVDQTPEERERVRKFH